MRAEAYIFDVFGTIVDWRSGVATESKKFLQACDSNIDPFLFADQWRGKYQPAMQKIRSGGRGYVPLDQLHRENLDDLLEEHKLQNALNEAEKQALNKAWEKLPPWADSVSGLNAVKNSAIIAPCSNGSIALMTRLAKFGQLPWDCILGAEIAKNYKPHPDAYLKSIESLGLSVSQVCMVAAHNSDLEAAAECGLQTAFIARPTEYGTGQTIDLTATGGWDQIVHNIGELS